MSISPSCVYLRDPVLFPSSGGHVYLHKEKSNMKKNGANYLKGTKPEAIRFFSFFIFQKKRASFAKQHAACV